MTAYRCVQWRLSGRAAVAAGATTSTPPTPPPSTTQATLPPTTAPAERDAAWLLAAMDLIEARAYFADRVDWAARREEAVQLAATPAGPAQLGSFLSVVLGDLEDDHSSLIDPLTADALISPQPELTGPAPLGRLLDGGVGRLQLPSFAGGAERQGDRLGPAESSAVDTYVTAARRLLGDPAACGWVLDLRGNFGGNAFVMLAAAAPLLGAGTFVGFQDRGGHLSGIAVADDGSTVEVPEVSALGSAPGSAPVLESVPVAVITDAVTASAAEMVALAFIGRSQSRSFGAPTAGVPTATAATFLSDGSLLNLTEAIGVDRTGRTYEGPIAPDEPTGRNDQGDRALTAALEWMRGAGDCP